MIANGTNFAKIQLALSNVFVHKDFEALIINALVRTIRFGLVKNFENIFLFLRNKRMLDP